MIRVLKGVVTDIEDSRLVIMCNSGVGYEIYCTKKFIGKVDIDSEIILNVYMQVSQDGMALYGFECKRELLLFKTIIKVNGIGCKGALDILEVEPKKFCMAIVENDVKALTAIKGIGNKTAQRILIELKDSIGNVDTDGGKVCESRVIAVQALLSLGYDKGSIECLVNKLNESLSTEELIKEALAVL